MIASLSIIDYFSIITKTYYPIILLILIIFSIFFYVKKKNIKKTIVIFLGGALGFSLISLFFSILVYMNINNLYFFNKIITFDDIKDKRAQDVLIFENSKNEAINFDTGFEIEEVYKYNKSAFYIDKYIVNCKEKSEEEINNSDFYCLDSFREKIENGNIEYFTDMGGNTFTTKQGIQAVEYFNFANLNVIPMGSPEKYINVSKTILFYIEDGYVKISLKDNNLKISNREEIIKDTLEKIMNNEEKKGGEISVFKEIFNKIKETVEINEDKLFAKEEENLAIKDNASSEIIDEPSTNVYSSENENSWTKVDYISSFSKRAIN